MHGDNIWFYNTVHVDSSICIGILKCNLSLGQVSEEMRTNLDEPYTREVVFIAIQNMNSTKAQELDGMSPIFYKNNWSLVGNPISNMVTMPLIEECSKLNLTEQT